MEELVFGANLVSLFATIGADSLGTKAAVLLDAEKRLNTKLLMRWEAAKDLCGLRNLRSSIWSTIDRGQTLHLGAWLTRRQLLVPRLEGAAGPLERSA